MKFQIFKINRIVVISIISAKRRPLLDIGLPKAHQANNRPVMRYIVQQHITEDPECCPTDCAGFKLRYSYFKLSMFIVKIK